MKATSWSAPSRYKNGATGKQSENHVANANETSKAAVSGGICA